MQVSARHIKWLFVLLISAPLAAQAQTATFKELRVPCTKFNEDDTTLSITYPIVMVPNKPVADRINAAIKRELLDEGIQDSTLSTEASLRQYAHDNLREMSYTVLFNKNGLLSIEVQLAAIGFYDYEFKRHFLFDLSSGKLLALADVIIPGKYQWFKKTMLQLKKNELEKYERGLKPDLDSGYIDKQTYDLCIQRIKDNHCKGEISLDEFSLTPSGIKVYNGCFFPHSLMRVAPEYRLRFEISKDNNILQSGIANRLFSR